ARSLHDALRSLAERERRFGRSKAQGRVYAALEAAGWRLGRKALLERADASDSALRALVDAGLMRIAETEHLRDPFADVPVTPPPVSLTGRSEERRVGKERGCQSPRY